MYLRQIDEFQNDLFAYRHIERSKPFGRATLSRQKLLSSLGGSALRGMKTSHTHDRDLITGMHFDQS